MLTLPFSVLPGVSRLFLDYCTRSHSAPNYFLGHFSDLMAYETHLQFLEQRTYHRRELTERLRALNTAAGAGPATLAAIDALGRDDSFAVVTGQQVGLFTGPVYTIYKALTARALAVWLTERFPSYTFVPVFWMETEDHDLVEADTAAYIDAANDLKTVHAFVDEAVRAVNLRAVGGITFDAGIDDAVTRMLADSLQTEFTPWVKDLLARSYREGATFSSAFASFFHALLPDAGIVLLDPSDPALKQLLVPVLLQELDTHPVSGEEVIKRSAELEERYHAQIKPRAVNLFLTHKGGRHAIEPGETGFFLRGTRQRFTHEELVEIATSQPELFSPNVLLRPVFQDYLLPTAAYVAGPAEVSYFAQLQPVYDHFKVPMPIIAPRASLTLVEKKIQKVVDKFDLSYASLFEDPDAIYRGMTAQDGEGTGLRQLEEFKTRISDMLPELTAIAGGIDTNLAEPARTTMAAIERSLDVFATKAFNAHKQRDTVVRRQLEKMQVYTAPGGKPQERVYSIVTFLNKYGPALIADLETVCQPFPAEHRLHLL
jgi:bacillithiol synthase